MDPQSHYALLVAINHYPGLSNLSGPENDANELAAWLIGTGGVDRERVKVIKSSDYDPVKEPYDANPTDTHIKKALNAWLKVDGKWLDRVGERLYLFFAGHGFTAGTLTDPALFTAQAYSDDRSHIAALRYAMKIANAGFFDEIVLVMDCCQDVLKSASVSEPLWSPPDRSAADRVKIMKAFGAPRGHKAYEDAPPKGTPPTHPVRGYFSKVFLEALEGAPADSEGRVTARAVEDHFLTLWPPYQQRFGYVPPIEAPRDLVLYRRHVRPPDVGHLPPEDAVAPSPPGLPPREITIELTDPAMQVNVLDASDRVVARAAQTARLQLPPGRYRAQINLGRTLHQASFRLEPDGSVLQGPSLEAGITSSGPGLPFWKRTFASPVPAPWSTTCHEYHIEPCRQLLDEVGAAARSFDPGHPSESVFFLFARDSADKSEGEPWRMSEAQRHAFRLRRLGKEGPQEPVALDTIMGSDADRWRGITKRIASGTWLLGVRRRLQGRWIWDDVVVEAAPGMRTEVYLDCIDDAEDGRRYDVDEIAISAVPWQSGSAISGDALRHTELLRAVLERAGDTGAFDASTTPTDPDTVGPIGTLYAAVLAAMGGDPDTRRVRELTAWLRRHWTGHSADVALLDAWCTSYEMPLDASHALPIDAVPMIDRCWALLGRLGVPSLLSPELQKAVALWRTSGGVLVQTQTPDALERRDNRARDAMQVRTYDAYTLARLADSLSQRRPESDASPVHQALRQALIDSRDEPDADALAAVQNIAREAAIDMPTLDSALNDLWGIKTAQDAMALYETTKLR